MTAEVRTNRRGQHCARYGQWLEPGQGFLYQDQDDDSWYVLHLDKAQCEANLAQQKAEENSHKASETQLKAERDKLSKTIKSVDGSEEHTDWSWDDFRFSLGRVLLESDHYEAREYLEDGKVIGFTIKDCK